MTGDVHPFWQVCIIESPSPKDTLEKRNEGGALSQALSLANVKNNYYFVTDGKTLDTCFEKMHADTAITEEAGKVNFPSVCIHFSAHGNEDSIALTAGDHIRWKELGDKLLTFGRKSGRAFPEAAACMQTVCFSTCHGLHGAKMAKDRQVCPFYGVVGPQEVVGWADSLTAFVTFYHNVCHKNAGVAKGVERMNAAIGRTELFHAVVAEQLGFADE